MHRMIIEIEVDSEELSAEDARAKVAAYLQHGTFCDGLADAGVDVLRVREVELARAIRVALDQHPTDPEAEPVEFVRLVGAMSGKDAVRIQTALVRGCAERAQIEP